MYAAAHQGESKATYFWPMEETESACHFADFNFENRSIDVTPEKGSEPRQLPISTQLIVAKQPTKRPRATLRLQTSTLCKNIPTIKKQSIIQTQKRHCIQKIHFHTLRHWKATTEYSKTKDILHVYENNRPQKHPKYTTLHTAHHFQK